MARELQGYQHDWYISGGWTLDLFLGRGERVHHDLDVVVRRSDQRDLQTHLMGRGWSLMTPGQGGLEPWPSNMFLKLPRHQIHAFRDGALIDFQLSSIENSIWRYRRVPAITRSVDRPAQRKRHPLPCA